MIRFPLLTTLLLLLALPTQAARLSWQTTSPCWPHPGARSPLRASAHPARWRHPAAGTFRQPLDPGSTNESQGRVHSAPLLLTLTLPASGTLKLTTPPLADSRAIRHFATHPNLRFETPRVATPVGNHPPRSQDSLMTDYQALLARYDAPARARPSLRRPPPSPSPQPPRAPCPSTLNCNGATSPPTRPSARPSCAGLSP